MGMPHSSRCYFRLGPDAFLVEGRVDAAVHDATDGTVYLLDPSAYAVVADAERNRPLDDRWPDAGGLRLLAQLERLGLGFFDGAAAFVEKLTPHSPLWWEPTPGAPPRLHQLDWTITDACEGACDFCPRTDDLLPWQACLTCLRRPQARASGARPDDAVRAVEDIAAARVATLHIRGGDPLLAWERLEAIVIAARDRLNVVVTTPGLGRSPVDVATLAHEAHIVVNVVVKGTDAIDRTCRFRQQSATIDALRSRGVRHTITCIITADDHDRLAAIEQTVRTRFDREPRLAEMRRRSEGGGALPFVAAERKTLTACRSRAEWFARRHRNRCLLGRAELVNDGSVHPCAAIDADGPPAETGHIREAIVAAGLDRWWFLTPDRIDPCRACAVRYACPTCTAVMLRRDSCGPECCPCDPSGPLRVSAASWTKSDDVRTLTASQETP
jgi:MoaA/NifB/PqqE/SkfB family radical SAM enzyme